MIKDQSNKGDRLTIVHSYLNKYMTDNKTVITNYGDHIKVFRKFTVRKRNDTIQTFYVVAASITDNHIAKLDANKISAEEYCNHLIDGINGLSSCFKTVSQLKRYAKQLPLTFNTIKE